MLTKIKNIQKHSVGVYSLDTLLLNLNEQLLGK